MFNNNLYMLDFSNFNLKKGFLSSKDLLAPISRLAREETNASLSKLMTL